MRRDGHRISGCRLARKSAFISQPINCRSSPVLEISERTLGNGTNVNRQGPVFSGAHIPIGDLHGSGTTTATICSTSRAWVHPRDTGRAFHESTALAHASTGRAHPILLANEHMESPSV